MKQLTQEDISKNNVNTIKQFKTLEYLKQCLMLSEFKVYLYNDYTLKVVDKNNEIGYFEYDEMTKEILFIDGKDYENEMNIEI